MAEARNQISADPRELTSLVNSLGCVLYEMKADTFHVTYVSANAERLLGYPTEAWLTQPSFLADHLHPEDRDWALAFCEAESAAGHDHELEYRMMTADGSVRWFRDVVTVSQQRNAPKTLRGVMMDITDRKEAEQLLAERERYSRLVIETAREAFIAIDTGGRVTDWNHQAEQIFGWTRAEATGESLAEMIIPPRYREDHWRGVERFLRTGQGEVLQRPMELHALRRDGHEFPVEITVWAVQVGGTLTFNAFVRDITRRREGEDELRRLNADFQALARRLLRVQEEGRRRAANDLHDGALQMISAAQMYFETLVAKIGPSDPTLVDGVREYLARAVDECRSVIATMRPGLLQDFGLTEGLRKYVAELGRRASRHLEFSVVGPDSELDEVVGGNLFRIVQEAVSNAVQHSGSDRVRVTLKQGPRRLTIQVRDWGCGFDQHVRQRLSQGGQHIGLLVMAERAALIGGRLSIASAIGKGTTVTVDLSLPSKTGSHDRRGH